MSVTAELGAGESLADRAYAAIRDRLVMLEIRPGDPLNDDRLAAELGTGRTPVREALKRLEVDRLVVAYPRRGTFATPVDITDLANLSQVRFVLEPLAARAAARDAGAADRAALRELARTIAGLDPEGDPRALLRADVEVHRALYRATGNPHLEDVCVRLDNLATRIWVLFLDRLPALPGHVHEHADLLDAVVAGEEDRAEALARAHVEGFERSIRALL
ncbi:GntR family transcriptional regulator [Pseudonocardia sp. WMMC193]|uniref:GntR family transcriptional regulator n=1 Tax=Pseudonocardia sp. WMMC193 TaxID=2911965 RepID=UPI001F1EAC2E|nr:GntR family transcriptional regulator [Pseudonocardia sp. WMMC193]MCF7549892.1 GntR family transcriptional regulator [Pseudonocardia sp. WMMC193]